MRLPIARSFGRRARLVTLCCALLITAAAIRWAPPLALVALAAIALIVLWDYLALNHEVRALAATIAAEEPTTKLEVTEGAWGELCHALNRLLQQRRTQRRINALLPTLPPAHAARLADAGIPPEGLPREVAVLALAVPPATDAGVARLRTAAEAASAQALLHEGLLARTGNQILLIFGATAPQSPAATLRAAREAARAIAHALGDNPQERPLLALTTGTARAVVLPGIGLCVLGGPVEEALRLQALALPGPLVCDENAYLGLRRLGAVPPQPAAPHRSSPNERPAYAVSL